MIQFLSLGFILYITYGYLYVSGATEISQIYTRDGGSIDVYCGISNQRMSVNINATIGIPWNVPVLYTLTCSQDPLETGPTNIHGLLTTETNDNTVSYYDGSGDYIEMRCAGAGTKSDGSIWWVPDYTGNTFSCGSGKVYLTIWNLKLVWSTVFVGTNTTVTETVTNTVTNLQTVTATSVETQTITNTQVVNAAKAMTIENRGITKAVTVCAPTKVPTFGGYFI